MDDKKDIKQLIDDLLINKYGIKNKSNKNKIKRRKARKYH